MIVRHAKILTCVVAVALLFSQSYLVVSGKSTAASWTFMVYLDADNNLDSFGPINLQWMSDGLSPGVSVNVIVLMDRLNLPAYSYEVTHQQIKVVQSLGEVDMGNPETLASFVTFAMKTYPAAHFFLDLWDHGGGYAGVCWDESSGHHLSPHDVETALASAESNAKGRVDVIGFDACLMGMIEVCYELKDVTNVVVGSEMLVPGYGWPYTQLMAYLSAHPNVDPSSFGSELVNEYVSFYPKSKVQMSAVDEASIPNLATSLDKFADALGADIPAYQGAIAGARSDAQQKFILGTQGSGFYVDLCKFARLVGERTHDAFIESLSQDLTDKSNLAVISQAYTAQIGNMDSKQFGLTINFPPNIKAYSISYETDVPRFAHETSWLSFLMIYYNSK